MLRWWLADYLSNIMESAPKFEPLSPAQIEFRRQISELELAKQDAGRQSDTQRAKEIQEEIDSINDMLNASPAQARQQLLKLVSDNAGENQ